MAETLADLYRRVGLHSAWEDQPEAQPNYTPPRPLPRRMRSPQARAYDSNPGVREQALQQLQREQTLRGSVTNREAYTPPRNQVAEAGQYALETTGAPSLARGIQHVGAGEPGEAIPEFLMGGLGLLGTATLPFGGGARPGALIAASELPPARLPVNPARMPGRATDGSVLPVRTPEPVRNSLRGGSDDLAEAAAMRPDAGARGVEQLRTQGFDVETPLYRGHDGDPSTGHWRASEGMNGEGVYLTRDPERAGYWANRQAENDPTVHTVYARGRIADSRDGISFEEAREQGYSGLNYYEDGRYVETVIFDPANVSPSTSRRALNAPNAGPPLPPRRTPRGRK